MIEKCLNKLIVSFEIETINFDLTFWFARNCLTYRGAKIA